MKCIKCFFFFLIINYHQHFVVYFVENLLHAHTYLYTWLIQTNGRRARQSNQWKCIWFFIIIYHLAYEWGRMMMIVRVSRGYCYDHYSSYVCTIKLQSIKYRVVGSHHNHCRRHHWLAPVHQRGIIVYCATPRLCRVTSSHLQWCKNNIKVC